MCAFVYVQKDVFRVVDIVVDYIHTYFIIFFLRFADQDIGGLCVRPLILLVRFVHRSQRASMAHNAPLL